MPQLPIAGTTAPNCVAEWGWGRSVYSVDAALAAGVGLECETGRCRWLLNLWRVAIVRTYKRVLSHRPLRHTNGKFAVRPCLDDIAAMEEY